jgi:hypothetical protein
LGNPKISQFFVDDDGASPAGDLATSNKMAEIVKKLTGRKNDPLLTIDEMLSFKDTDPKIIEKYSELNKVFTANYKAGIQKFVRLSGKPFVDVKVAAKYLDAIGCNKLPRGFVGNIDEKGQLYTTAGKLLKGRAYGNMEMNKAYDPKTDNTYYAKLLGSQRGELRTADFLKRSKGERFDKISDFADNLETHRARWLKDMDSTDPLTKLAATFIEVIHQTKGRIGGDKNENDGQPTYGITTIRAKHIKYKANEGLQFDYPGKKGTMQHHLIRNDTPSNKKIIAMFKQLYQGKKPDDYLFALHGKHLVPQTLNKYLKSIGVDVTVH